MRRKIFTLIKEVVTTTSNKYAAAFGFTEEEVFEALDQCGLGEEKDN